MTDTTTETFLAIAEEIDTLTMRAAGIPSVKIHRLDAAISDMIDRRTRVERSIDEATRTSAAAEAHVLEAYDAMLVRWDGFRAAIGAVECALPMAVTEAAGRAHALCEGMLDAVGELRRAAETPSRAEAAAF